MPPDPSNPIIVGGCYRSGTSLVRRILDAHPRIYCGPEVKFFRDFYGDYVKDPIRHLRFMETAHSMLDEEQLFKVLGAAFVEMHEHAARIAGKARWADKVPENVVFLDEWGRLLGEDWLFVHVVRNPLDTLASIKEREFPASIPAGFEARLGLYLEYTQAGLDFGEAHPERYVRVLYDELVMRPEQNVRTLMDRLGEVFHPGQLALNSGFHQSGLEDPTVSRTTEIHRDSLERWRRDLTHDEIHATVDAVAEIWPRIDAGGGHPLPPRGNS